MTSTSAARPRAAQLDDNEAAQARQALELQWRDLMGEVTELTVRLHDLRAALGGDRDDVAAAVTESELVAAQLEAARAAMARVEQALAGLEDGTYGVCADCGRQIPAERLEALPHTRRCASCQSLSAAR